MTRYAYEALVHLNVQRTVEAESEEQAALLIAARLGEEWPEAALIDVLSVQPDEGEPVEVEAQPYEARRCPKCEVWVYVAAGPFAEDDPTKTEADWLHWRDEHLTAEEREASHIGFPFMSYNEQPVTALRERRAS